jgi:Cu/Ag efflux protein CusF
MQGVRGLAVAAACSLALAACGWSVPVPWPATVWSTSAQEGKGRLSASDAVTATATVEAVDPKGRMITLRRPDGQRLRFRVSDDVKNLPQVKKGDEVNVTYYESVGLQLRKPGEATTGVTVAEEAERAKPGGMPAGAAAEVVTVTSKVIGIDRRNRTATLELPSKEKLTLKVEDPARLDKVKVGDLVEATYREAIAVAVEKPSAR